MKVKNDPINTLKQAIDSFDDLLVISHILPDGDNIGSVIAFSAFLRSAGKKVTAVVNGVMPPYYLFLEGARDLVPPEALTKRSYAAVICLDMGDKERGGDVWEKVEGTPTLVNIDHHLSNDGFGDYNYVRPEASSTAEIVTELLTAWGVTLTKAMAEALYTGMLTDSGCFTYGSTSPQTMTAAATLLAQKPDLEAIRENVLENVSFKRKKLLAEALAKATLTADGRLCYAAIDLATIRRLGVQGPDFENIIDHLIGVTGVTYAVFFREMAEHEVKVGFRGRGDCDVTVVAAAFGGGGHKAAAGCTLRKSLDEAVELVLREAVSYLEAM